MRKETQEIKALFDSMLDTPILFESAEDYDEFKDAVRQNHPLRWFHGANNWNFDKGHCCIGINGLNKQICTSGKSMYKSSPINYEEVRHLFVGGTDYVKVDDLL